MERLDLSSDRADLTPSDNFAFFLMFKLKEHSLELKFSTDIIVKIAAEKLLNEQDRGWLVVGLSPFVRLWESGTVNALHGGLSKGL